MTNGGRHKQLHGGDIPGVSESRSTALDIPEPGGRINTDPSTYALVKETDTLPEGLLGKTDVARQICTGHQRKPGDEGRIAVSPVGEAQHQQIRASQVQVVGALADDLGAGVLGYGEGLDEAGSPRRPSPILAMQSASTRVSTRL